jgi:formylglycine-generating enzyme required for sulfatase activity
MTKTCLVTALVAVLIQIESPREQPCPPSPAAGARCTVGGIEFAAIPAGTFAMGDASGTAAAIEQPVHDVTLDAFWMARTELTLKQWNAFVGATGHPLGRSRADSDEHPVVGITWEDARVFCEWFSKTHGVVARVPSEAEWEYAARGGLRGRQYPNGDTISPSEANYASSGAVKVASYPANGYGLHDMAGNVGEWVADWYDMNYYRASPSTNPRGPATQDKGPQRKADRGGGWCLGAERVRVAARHAGPGSWDEGGTARCLGVRILMEGRPAR